MHLTVLSEGVFYCSDIPEHVSTETVYINEVIIEINTRYSWITCIYALYMYNHVTMTS